MLETTEIKTDKEENTNGPDMIEIIGTLEMSYCAKCLISHICVRQAIKIDNKFSPVDYPQVEIYFTTGTIMFKGFDNQQDAIKFYNLIIAAHREPGNSTVNVKDVYGEGGK
jgi:hypothetical protein